MKSRLVGYGQFILALLLAISMFVNRSVRADVGQFEMSPAEMHRQMGAAKAASLARQRVTTALVTPAMEQGGFDATYYALDIRVDEVTTFIYGKVSLRARARVDGFSIPVLNFTTGLTVDSVRSFGRPVVWTHASGFLNVTLDSTYNTGEEFEVTVFYWGHPPEGGFQGFAFGTHAGTPIISTLSEPYLSQSWWPCKDVPSDKADSVDMRVTVNSAFYAVSNGVLRDSINNGNGTTSYVWHESYPITTYLVSLAISNYARFDRWYHHGADSMPVRFYSYPEVLSSAVANWPIAVDQIAFYAATFGEYPFIAEKYGMVHFNWGGGMEHQTVTSATSSGFGFGQYLVCHELSHQWWGDMITCRNWNHIWMNEGFASYAEALWAEHLGGTSSYQSYMASMNYFTGGRIYIDDTTNVGNIFSSRVYDKGAWVLHMLRGIIGDSAFFATFRAYYADPRYAYKDVVTEEFRDIAETVSGVNLHDFFNDWIYGYYFPKYAYSWASTPSGGGYKVYIHLRQYQATSPLVFHMPVVFRINGTGGLYDDHRVMDTLQVQDFVIQTSLAPTSVSIDPNNWILDQSVQESFPLSILSDSLVSGVQFVPYHDSLIVKGGTAPYQYTLVSGTLPAGLSFDTTKGTIDGVPSVSSAISIRLGAWDNGKVHYTEKVLNLSIAAAPFKLGDLNGDGNLDVLDIVMLIDYVFAGGPAPSPLNLADVNHDCAADVLDVVYLVDAIFQGGPAPLYGCLT